MHKLRSLLFVFLFLSSFSLHAMNGIFWQPQDRDLNISDVKWASLMQEVRKQGFDTLVVQWTRYGESFSTEESRAKLQKKVLSAQEAGLKLIIGLYADPEFFNRQQQPSEALKNYLNRLRVLDIKQVQLWKDVLGAEPEGWYISAEIDDANWRDEAIRTHMLTWLRDTKNQIKQYSSQPVYISTFFSGNMSPDSYRVLIEDIQAEGVKVWIQDGSGVAKLTANERALYLNPNFKCLGSEKKDANGIVYELFTIKPDGKFSASPKSETEINTLLDEETTCAEQRLYFSLRYLPISADILEYHSDNIK